MMHKGCDILKHSDKIIKEIEQIVDVVVISEPNVYGGFKRDYQSWQQYSISISIEKKIKNYREQLQRCYFKMMYMLNKEFGFIDYKFKETGNKYVKTINVRIKYEQ